MLAHRFEFGDVSDVAYDAMVEQLANGAVLAMRAYFEITFPGQLPPPLHELNLGYRLPEGRASDPTCQVTPLGDAFFVEARTRGAITCKEAAIYHAAWEQACGHDAWVRIRRPNSTGHAVVYYPLTRTFFDPSQQMLRRNDP